MNWISSVVRPKIQSFWTKRDVPKNLWIKCPETGEMVFHRDLETNGWVVPGSGFHMRMPVENRLESLFDGGVYQTIDVPPVPHDPLKFRDERRYQDRLRDARAKTGRDDAVSLAKGALDALTVVVAVQDFAFMGGSLGMAAGEAIVTGAQGRVRRRLPLRPVRSLRRRAHAGGHPLADADAAHHRGDHRAARRPGCPTWWC